MEIRIEKNVMVPMRDGIKLATDVYRPAEEGRVPVLLMRLPYSKESQIWSGWFGDVQPYVQAGYAVVIQDVRGRFASEGTFVPYEHEAADSVDTIAWTAAQSWSTGRVGMVGGSYLGAIQWLAAAEQPPALRAIAPAIIGGDPYDQFYQGGALQFGKALNWILSALTFSELPARIRRGEATMQDLEAVVQAITDIDALYQHLPLNDLPLLQKLAPFHFKDLEHPDYDEYWQQKFYKDAYERITIPALNIGGWFDLYLNKTIANYQRMKRRGGSSNARQQQLIIGPWSHMNTSGNFPERDFGPLASVAASGLTQAQIRWFDRWLKESDSSQEKPVKLFVMGINQWREEEDWPLPDTQYRPYYLHSAGRANTANGNGTLSLEQPGEEPEDVYLYDPRYPVPTVGGATLMPGGQANVGPRDQRSVERRDDVLCYTTAPLERLVEVTGPIQLHLSISSSARDTDFTAKLIDVYPDGRSELTSDGILRVRYRESLARPVLMQPGEVYQLCLDLQATSNVFLVGHRIRLEISSSNFPRFDRNTNTGGTIATEGEQNLVQAVNRVYHDSTRPSHLLLPIIER
ncbi:X-Pro dipeptidyl-peptidase [Reticulibacter mediterranei]|uniref:X-Pro dipeptidyl-peptidase n=1 Tax=Reticulibacter mediterranei TaxID=2778369 RepID=A0A8J3N8F5_9CHLR|nr:CocE/NonD family hydrolase [Reticulibacter mediterranei]GHO98207.1 X-Pro dipeptidyl-peptidase [Reticulibacter mediterranei]